jgi:hypothetical protein
MADYVQFVQMQRWRDNFYRVRAFSVESKMKCLKRPRLVCLLLNLSMLALGSSIYAQQPRVWAPTASNPSGFPEKAPQGWDQKRWDGIRASCNRFVKKARAHEDLTPHEFAESAICMHLSVDLFDAQTPAPGAYLYPETPKPDPSATPTATPGSKNPSPDLSH